MHTQSFFAQLQHEKSLLWAVILIFEANMKEMSHVIRQYNDVTGQEYVYRVIARALNMAQPIRVRTIHFTT